jgi:fructose-1,6-bisphosphatase I
MRHLREAPVAAIASEELDDWVLLDADKPLAVAFDPLDGSSNIDANMSIGTIFSILPATEAKSPFGQAGSAQIAAGFVVYGPQTTLALTMGEGVDIFTLDRRDDTWRLTSARVRIPDGATEYAINASNYRHWEEPVRIYIDDCLNGAEGPRAKNFNMRWIGSLVAEAYRILNRGGVFLYPGDLRKGYGEGRLRLLYEAHPIAFIITQAGGLASTGRARILELAARSIHQRTPLIFGAWEKVRHIEGLHAAPDGRAEPSPLFSRRGLFRH